MSLNTYHDNNASTLKQLCYHLSERNEDESLRMFRHALELMVKMTKQNYSSNAEDFSVANSIKSRISDIKGKKEVFFFSDLHRKLQRQKELRQRANVLQFLFMLSQDSETSNMNIFTAASPVLLPLMENFSFAPQKSPQMRGVSGPMPAPPQPSYGDFSAFHQHINFSNDRNTRPYPNHQLNAAITSRRMLVQTTTHQVTMATDASTRASLDIPSTMFASETTLLQDLIYCFQGIDGQFLKREALTRRYRLDARVKVSRAVQQMVLRHGELGSLHNQVRDYVDSTVGCKASGLVAQSLVSQLRTELTRYYRLIAILQSQLQQDHTDLTVDSPLSEEQPLPSLCSLSLVSLGVWTHNFVQRMQCLAAVLEVGREKRGGALASVVHGFLQHSNPLVKDTVKDLLATVCKPICVMMSRWILDGELEDPHNEFFIAANQDIKGDRLWHEKYRVLDSMLPSFISLAQARRILATGKSINFLREICQDEDRVRVEEGLRSDLDSSNMEKLVTSDSSGDLQAMVDRAYLATSRRVLDVMTGKYKFVEHLQALRRYLLLGQGDFIRHLMEMLKGELVKPASQLYSHTLSSMLDTAARATNAQFEDEDILKRLDVRLLEPSPGDTGWDVFSLDYHVDGPIGTVFAPKMTSYLMLFNALWRAKRMEWILSGMWKQIITSAKPMRNIPELTPVVQQTHLLTSEMVHFVHQMQYYILFEVLECSWDVLIKQVLQAEALDDVITAHDNFLHTIKAGALLDKNSENLATQLRAVFDLILQLQAEVMGFHSRSLEVLDTMASREKREAESEMKNEFGASDASEALEKEQLRQLVEEYLPTVRAKLRVLAKSYQAVVRKFLLTLASQTEVSLQLLSFRLDFNEHYKRRDSRLTAPFTYQHRRLSEMGVLGTK